MLFHDSNAEMENESDEEYMSTDEAVSRSKPVLPYSDNPKKFFKSFKSVRIIYGRSQTLWLTQQCSIFVVNDRKMIGFFAMTTNFSYQKSISLFIINANCLNEQ